MAVDICPSCKVGHLYVSVIDGLDNCCYGLCENFHKPHRIAASVVRSSRSKAAWDDRNSKEGVGEVVK